MSLSKSLKAARAKVDPEKTYSVEEAVKIMLECSTVKFDATAEVHFRLGIDPRHADQQIRTTMTLPHGTGKKTKVIVFCDESDAKVAKAAGAIEAGSEDLIDKISKGWTDFDVAVASPEMMKGLAKVARVLGPKGLMPNPKSGTVTKEIEKTVTELCGGRIEFRNDKHGIIHSIFGKLSFGDKKLVENLKALLQAIQDAKPSGQKGNYFKSISVHSTMGVGIKLHIPGAATE